MRMFASCYCNVFRVLFQVELSGEGDLIRSGSGFKSSLQVHIYLMQKIYISLSDAFGEIQYLYFTLDSN